MSRVLGLFDLILVNRGRVVPPKGVDSFGVPLIHFNLGMSRLGTERIIESFEETNETTVFIAQICEAINE